MSAPSTISLGIGPPASVPFFLLFGLWPTGPVAPPATPPTYKNLVLRDATAYVTLGVADRTLPIRASVYEMAPFQEAPDMGLELSLDCYKGEAPGWNFTFNPVPSGGISGWTIVMAIRASEGGAAITTGTTSITDASAATGTISFTSANMQLLTVGQEYIYDVWRTDSGSENCLRHGKFIAKAGGRF